MADDVFKDARGRVYIPAHLRLGPTGRTMGPWVQPDDMPTELAEKVARGEACGAKMQGKKQYCEAPPDPGQREARRRLPWRCAVHGARGGYNDKSLNALKHGVYAKGILPTEQKLLRRLKPGNVDHEIVMTRLRLARAMAAEKRQWETIYAGKKPRDAAETPDEKGGTATVGDTFVTESREVKIKSKGKKGANEGETGSDSTEREISTSQRIKDWGPVVHRILVELVKLEHLRLLLLGPNVAVEMTPHERARLTRAALAEAEAMTIGMNGHAGDNGSGDE